MGKLSTVQKSNYTKAMNKWLRDPNRETLKFIDCFGKRAEITANTRLVPAICTRKTKGHNYGSKIDRHLVSENGYMVSFDDGTPQIIGSDSGKGYCSVSINGQTEKLHRIIWLSFAIDAIRNRKREEMPLFVIVKNKRLETRGSARLTESNVKKLISQPSEKYEKLNPRSNMPKQYEVHHINFSQSDNSISNLELVAWWMHNFAPNSLHSKRSKLEERVNREFEKGIISAAAKDEIIALIRFLPQMIMPLTQGLTLTDQMNDMPEIAQKYRYARQIDISSKMLEVVLDNGHEYRVIEVGYDKL